MSGRDGFRGYIFQTMVSIINCLENPNWTRIKVEPETAQDKVDIVLYSDEKILSCIQVKSSINPFQKSDIEKWLQALQSDSLGGQNDLVLVGEKVTSPAAAFISLINETRELDSIEHISIPHDQFPNLVRGTIVEYLQYNHANSKVNVDEIETLFSLLMTKLTMNSISKRPYERGEFEKLFLSVITKNSDVLSSPFQHWMTYRPIMSR